MGDEENTFRLKKFGVKHVQGGIYREGFMSGLQVAEQYYEKNENLIIPKGLAISKANGIIRDLRKENNKLNKEVKELKSINKQMVKNAEEHLKIMEEKRDG